MSTCAHCGKPIEDGQKLVVLWGTFDSDGYASPMRVWHAECNIHALKESADDIKAYNALMGTKR